MSGVLNHSASDVYSSERNLSQVIRAVATTIGATVGASDRGPLGPYAVTSKQIRRALYGPSNPATSFMHICVDDCLDWASTTYVNRVVGAGFAYSGTLIQNFGTVGNRVFRLLPFGMANFKNPRDGINFATAGGVSDANENLAYVHAIGPGSFYDNYAIDIQSKNLVPPSNVTLTSATAGGVLASGSYQYQVTALGAKGETLATTAVTTTLGSGITTGLVTVSWDAVPGALGYRVYGRAAGLVALLGSTDSNTLSYVDRGNVAPSGALPTVAPGNDNIFTIRVFDTSESITVPKETWDVSLEGSTDGFGNQTDIETVINSQSQYIRVVSNFANMTQALPVYKTLARSNFTGGLNGAAVTDADIIAGYNEFIDKDQIRVNVLFASGYTSASVAQAMIQLCESRRDSVAILDTPSTQQAVQNAIVYRRITINANTSRAMQVTPDYQRIDPDSKKLVWAPVSGATAARMAYTDFIANAGTSFAGLNRGVLPNAIKLRFNYDGGMRDQLASSQISYYRSKLGRGTFLAEQLTLTNDFSALSFMSVRRIFDILENAMQEALLYSLQENNTDFTGVQISNMLSTYLEGLKRSLVITNYTVVIDQTPATRGQGLLAIDVAIEPVLPVNQISLRTTITRQGEIKFVETA